MTALSANQRDRPISGGPVSGPPRSLVQPRTGSTRIRTVERRPVPSGPGRGGGRGRPVHEDGAALSARELEFGPRLLGPGRPSGAAGTDLCLEPIPARAACRESLVSPPARSWSHFPERKSVSGSGPGGTCSKEWRRRVRRCAWLDDGAPRPARLGEWAVARGRLVLATREPATREFLPLWGRGMDSGSGSFGVECVTEGWRAGGTAGEWRWGGCQCGAELRVPPRPSRGPRLTLGLTSLIHLIRGGSRAGWSKSELLAKSSFGPWLPSL